MHGRIDTMRSRALERVPVRDLHTDRCKTSEPRSAYLGPGFAFVYTLEAIKGLSGADAGCAAPLLVGSRVL